MVARVERGDLAQIATNLGRAGKPLPKEMHDDAGLIAAHDQGLAEGGHKLPDPEPTPATSPASPAPSSARSPAPRKRSQNRKPAASAPNYAQRAVSPAAAVNRVPGVAALKSAGDGGGLFLAFVLYPLAISVLKWGAAGPGKWFRAKWLNQTDTQPNNLGAPAATRPDPYANVPGMPGYRSPTGPGGTFPSPDDPPPSNGPWGPRPPNWHGNWPPGGTGSAPPSTTGGSA